MDYEINVSLNGSHLFATHKRSVTYTNHKDMYKLFKKKFPKEEGYEISMSKVECSSQEIATTRE